MIVAVAATLLLGQANALPGAVVLKARLQSIGAQHARQLSSGVMARGRGVLELVGAGGAGSLCRRTAAGERIRRVALWAKENGEEGMKIGGKRWDMNKASPGNMLEMVRGTPHSCIARAPSRGNFFQRLGRSAYPNVPVSDRVRPNRQDASLPSHVRCLLTELHCAGGLWRKKDSVGGVRHHAVAPRAPPPRKRPQRPQDGRRRGGALDPNSPPDFFEARIMCCSCDHRPLLR